MSDFGLVVFLIMSVGVLLFVAAEVARREEERHRIERAAEAEPEPEPERYEWKNYKPERNVVGYSRQDVADWR